MLVDTTLHSCAPLKKSSGGGHPTGRVDTALKAGATLGRPTQSTSPFAMAAAARREFGGKANITTPDLTSAIPQQRCVPQEGGLPHGMVDLLTCEKVPARHRKLVTVQLSRVPESEQLLFTPQLGEADLALANVPVEGEDTLSATLLIENRGILLAFLEAGMELGTVVPVERVCQAGLEAEPIPPGESARVPDDAWGRVCVVAASDVQEWKVWLRTQLQEQFTPLCEAEQLELERQILSYHDIFAVQPLELGSTRVTETCDEHGCPSPNLTARQRNGTRLPGAC